MLKIIAAVAALAFASPAFACTGTMPPAGMVEPTVPYEIYHVRAAGMATACPGFPGTHIPKGCSYTAAKPWRWVMIVNDDVAPGEVACTIAYEKAHMPPNYWADPKVERPEYIAYLADMKRRGAAH